MFMQTWGRLNSTASFKAYFLNGIMKFSASASPGSALAKLRKVTGHPFSFCREALEASEGVYEHALEWIDNEASKRGLAKAEKLRNRPMSQGLLGLYSSSQCIATVELNCETDFVARNKDFQSLLSVATESFYKSIMNNSNDGLLTLTSESLGKLPIPTGQGSKPLSEALSVCISSVGENMAISRGVAIKLPKGDKQNQLMSYCHVTSVGEKGKVKFGKYVAMVRYRSSISQDITHAWRERASQLSLQLCQHIVGMNPRPGLHISPPAANPDDEKCLLLQKFLLDETVSVASLLAQNEISLEEFVRVECGRDEQPENDIQIQ